MLGVHIGYFRALCGAVFGWLVGGLVVRAFPLVVLTDAGAAAGLLVPLAGCAFAATLLFLFVAELAVPSGTGLGLFGQLRSVRARIDRARRYSRITHIAIRHGLGGYLAGRRDADLGPGHHAKLARSLRARGGRRDVRELGQLLSTRADLLPPAFVHELSLLQDPVAPAPADEVRAVLRDELGADPEDCSPSSTRNRSPPRPSPRCTGRGCPPAPRSW